MNAEDITTIETRMRLHERQLALKEAAEALDSKRARNCLLGIGVAIVFLCCFASACVGLCGFSSSVKDSMEAELNLIKTRMSSIEAKLDNPPAAISPGKSNAGDNTHRAVQTTITNSPGAQINGVAHDSKKDPQDKGPPPPSLPVATLIVRCVLVLAGLIVAALTVRAVARAGHE